jgi:hypothetical protein
MSNFRSVAVPSLVLLCMTIGCKAAPQAAAPSIAGAAQAAVDPLQPYSTPDGTASSKLPAGWQVVTGQGGIIDAKGPNGEAVDLGNVAVARNAAYQPGKVAGADLSAPYTSSLSQKLVMIFQHIATAAGQPAPQLNIISATPVQAPAAFGQCANILGMMSGAQGTNGPVNFEAQMCSLPLDSGGLYKNIFKYAQVPTGQAAKERATLEAILASYQVPLAVLQQKVAPATSAAGSGSGVAPTQASLAKGAEQLAEANQIMKQTMIQEGSFNNTINCGDLINIRETPIYQLPPSCGGPAR